MVNKSLRGLCSAGRALSAMSSPDLTGMEFEAEREEGERPPATRPEEKARVNEGFTPLCEDRISHRLENGNVLKVELVATMVERIGGTDRASRDESDDPRYVVASVNAVQAMRGGWPSASHRRNGARTDERLGGLDFRCARRASDGTPL